MKYSTFSVNVEKAVVKNRYYRNVVYTDKNIQLVYMRLRPKEEIGAEKHVRSTQFFRIESGKGMAIVGRRRYRLKDGVVVIVPPNTIHNIINTSKTEDLLLYTIYSPPEHVRRTKIPRLTKALLREKVSKHNPREY